MKSEHADDVDPLAGAERVLSAIEKVVRVLGPLESSERRQVIHATMVVLREKEELADRDGGVANSSSDISFSRQSLPARVNPWMKQNDISIHDLESIFDLSDNPVSVIASGILGKNNTERTIKAYVLSGVVTFLSTGEMTFDDKAARDLCVSLGCYDNTNHSKYLKEKKNYFSGSKEQGWKLTAPGLKYAAILIKELAESEGQ